VTTGEDQTVRAWDPATGKEKWKVTFPQTIVVTFALADAVVVEGRGIAEPLLDLATGKARKLPGAMSEGRKVPSDGLLADGFVYDSLVAVAPDGKSAVTVRDLALGRGGVQQTELRLWSWPAGELSKTIAVEVPKELFANIVRGRFSPDGKELHTVTWCARRKLRFSGEMSVPMLIDRYDAATGKRLDRKEMRDVYPFWTADGDRLFMLRDKNQIDEAFSGKAVVKLADDPKRPFLVWGAGGVDLSPDGKTIAVGSGWGGSGGLRLYDMTTGAVMGTIPVRSHGAVAVAFLPDGRFVTAGTPATVWAADAAEKIKPEQP
jgi:WD40 repeat protein